MSTRCIIAVDMGNDRFSVVYCHNDGYLEGVGQVLGKHYNNTRRARALVRLGDLSSLHPRLAPRKGEAHSFEARAPGVTVAYRRERGDTANVACTTSYTGLRPVARDCHADFVYMWSNGSWRVASMAGDLGRGGEVTYQRLRFGKVIDEPEDYYETFAGRGQEDQDAHDLSNGHPSGDAHPENPGEPTIAWPFPK